MGMIRKMLAHMVTRRVRSRFLALRGAIERFTADLERVLSEDAHFLSEKLELKF